MAESRANVTTDNSLTESLLSNNYTEKHDTTVETAQVIESSSSTTLLPTKIDPEQPQQQSDESESEYDGDTEDPESSRNWNRGEKQPSQWRDLPFGLLFHAQCSAVMVFAVMFGIPAVTNYWSPDKTELSDEQPTAAVATGPLYPILVAIGSATIFMIATLSIIITKAKSFISCLIISSAIFQIILGITALASGSVVGGAIPLFFGIIGCCYFFAVRRRIPFAAANLHAGVTAVRDHGGIVMLAYVWGVLTLGWLSLWSTVVYSTIVNGSVETCDTDEENSNCQRQLDTSTKIYLVLLVLSFYWTVQVSNNVVHTTVAGIVGTWYFDPSSEGAVWASGVRTLTYSFGSVCFGSLLVAIISTIRFMVNTRSTANDGRGESMLYCILDCILSLLEDVMEYFNKWAFIYVGLYGYPYITAGKKVAHLFQQRGWTVIINDDLIGRVLSFTSITVGLLCGVVQYLVFSNEALVVFGFVFGVFFSCTMMSVINSAVSTVVVCFAEAPEELESSHPDHSRAMKEAWYNVYQVRC